jgi:hypothetical protein
LTVGGGAHHGLRHSNGCSDGFDIH